MESTDRDFDDFENSVLGIFVHKENPVGFRLKRDSSIDEIKDVICKKWYDLTPLGIEFSCVRDGKKSVLETDYELQALVCYCCAKKITSISIQVSLVSASNSVVSYSDPHGAGDGGSSSTVLCDEAQSPLIASYGIEIETLVGVGQKFKGGAPSFRNALLLYCITKGYRVVFLKNSPQKITVECYLKSTTNCSWRVHASIKHGLPGFFMIKRMQPDHTCGAGLRDVNHPPVNSKLVKALILDRVRQNPMMKTKSIRDHFLLEYGVLLSYYFAYSGKAMAMKQIHGDISLSFHQLEWYLRRLVDTNPGSGVSVQVDPGNKFKRVFVSIGACVFGFNACRPLLFLDGTFLKGGKVSGCIMAATGKNANQGFFPLAYAIVPVEDEANWLWFLENLKSVLSDQRVITFISDRHWGLINGVARVFPNSPHVFCLYHLKKNLEKSIDSRVKKRSWIVSCFAKCAKVTTQSEFETAMADFKAAGGAWATNFLDRLPSERYANAHFPGHRYGELYSNVAESFNAWILQERYLPITSCLESIQLRLMKQFSDRRESGNKYQGFLCPEMEKKLRKIIDDGRSFPVVRSSDYGFQVDDPLRHLVELDKKFCSCNKWTVDGFPCVHVVRAIMVGGLSVYDFCDQLFSVSAFRAAYSHSIYPVLDADKPRSLPEPPILPFLLPPDPSSIKKVGRPPTKRREGTGGGLKRPIKCGRCKEIGHHNRKTCKAQI